MTEREALSTLSGYYLWRPNSIGRRLDLRGPRRADGTMRSKGLQQARRMKRWQAVAERFRVT